MKLNRSVAVIGATVVFAAGSVLVASTAFGEDAPTKPAPTAKQPSKGMHGFGAGMMFGLDPEALSTQVGKLPKELRVDLAEVLTTEDEAARAKLIEQIKTKAEAGKYGKQIQQQVTRAKEFGKRMDSKRSDAKSFWADAPKALKDDLAALRELPKAERKAAFEKIAAKAKAGDYGDEVKKKFEQFGQHGKKHPKSSSGAAADKA
ncbi:MAG TPA: hypothetical protein PLQ19_09890 [Aeromicrobium sp.]|nr:hypothetical protein [Aeromicrobium sp.]